MQLIIVRARVCKPGSICVYRPATDVKSYVLSTLEFSVFFECHHTQRIHLVSTLSCAEFLDNWNIRMKCLPFSLVLKIINIYLTTKSLKHILFLSVLSFPSVD